MELTHVLLIPLSSIYPDEWKERSAGASVDLCLKKYYSQKTKEEQPKYLSIDSRKVPYMCVYL